VSSFSALTRLGHTTCKNRPRNDLSINQSINQSWIYIAHKRKASNAL